MFQLSIERLQQIGHSRFIEKLITTLKLAFPETPPDDTQEFRQNLEKIIERANLYHIFQDRDVARYVCLTYLLGTNFDTRFPAARSILNDETRPADERLTLLEFWADKLMEALGEGK